MSKIPRPSEFWRVTAIAPAYRRERTYKGRGGRKKAYDFATFCKNNGAHEVLVECTIPQWVIDYHWEIG